MRLYAVPGGLVNVKRSYNESRFFRFTVQTSASPETFALPLEAGGTYDFYVDWGDDSSDNITAWNAAAVTHTYASAGTHTVSISGVIQGWRFNDAGDKLKIYDIKSWGPLRLGNNNGYFYGCTNLTVSATDVLDLTDTLTLRAIFRNCSSLTNIPSMNSWDFSLVTSLYTSFYEASLFDQDISAIDLSSVTTMCYAFYDTSFNQVVSGWNVSSVLCLMSTFDIANSFDQNLSSWNITSVTDATTFLQGLTFSVANYDALILSWSPQAQTIVANFHGGNSKYTGGGAVEAARDAWIAKGWTITDGGIAP